MGCSSLEMWSGHDLPGILGEFSEPQRGVPADSGPEEVAAAIDLPAQIGIAGLSLMAAGLLLLGRRGITKKEHRRGVNVFWDVISFWPHSAHPFVPPPYSQIAVPQLAMRIKYFLHLRRQKDGGLLVKNVIVAAHSQGSLVARFAAVAHKGEHIA